MEVEVVLRGIAQLSSPSREDTSMLKSLGGSLDAFEAFLQDTSQAELNAALQKATDSIKIPERELESSCSEDDVKLYCRFSMRALPLLCLLDEALNIAHAQDLTTAGKFKEESSKGAPPAPKALLSPAEEKSINTLLQCVVALGVFPHLLPGADSQLKMRLGPMASQIHKSSDSVSVRICYLYHHTRTLARMFATPVIGPSVLSRHLSTVLVALLQICYGPLETPQTSQTEGYVQQCRGELSALLRRHHQPLVVQALLGLQGSPGKLAEMRGREGRPHPGKPADAEGRGEGRRVTPRWLQRACGKLLSERLMQEDGVHKVVLGIFRAMSGDEEVGSGCHGDWKKVRAVARIISSCPSQASSLSGYYSTIAPQLLKLLCSPLVASVQVAAATISLMTRQQPALARTHLTDPLTLPLTQVTVSRSHHHLPATVGSDMETCVKTLHRLCGAVEPSSPVIQAIAPSLPVIFEVWRAVNETKTTSGQFRGEVRYLLVSVINSLDSSSVLEFLRCVSGLLLTQQKRAGWVTVSPEISIECSSEGGVLCVRSVSGEVGEMWSVGRMERVGQAILSLVATELKSSQLLGRFFLSCLTSVVAILCLDTSYSPPHPSVQEDMKLLSRSTEASTTSSTVLLDVERKMKGASGPEAYHRSLVLYLTAALSESFTDDVLEQSDTVQLLSVLSVAVKCHAHFVTSKHESSSSVDLLQIQPDLDRMLGGPITLSIAVGYLSAILGGAKKVDKEHRPLLSDLLQPLEVISTRYPGSELSALAGDLRVCVATLGAVWSVEMREVAEGRRRRGDTDKIVSGLKGEHPEVRKKEEKEGRSCERKKNYKRKLIEEIPEEGSSHQYSKEDKSTQTAFQQALAEANDHEIPVRGHGLTTLAKLLEAGDKETLNNSDSLLKVFKQSLLHLDSYVYLAAIKGLVALASQHPLAVLTTLCEEYALFGESSPRHEKGRVDRETGQLKKCTTQKPSPESGKNTDRENSFELRLKLGEALVRVARDCGELLPHYADMLLRAVLSNARDPHPLVRASALSNLADICRLLGHSFGNVHHEVLGCVSQLLLSDSTPQVQQAALLVFNLLLKGLSHRTVDVLGDSLRDIYRLLKRVEGEGETDELTRAHAQAALRQLDDVMRDWAFPQQTLTKHITIT